MNETHFNPTILCSNESFLFYASNKYPSIRVHNQDSQLETILIGDSSGISTLFANSNYLFSGTLAKNIFGWELSTFSLCYHIQHTDIITAFFFSNFQINGKKHLFLFVGSQDHKISAYDLSFSFLIFEIQLESNLIPIKINMNLTQLLTVICSNTETTPPTQMVITYSFE